MKDFVYLNLTLEILDKKSYFKNNFVSKALNFALYKYIIKNANLSLFQFYLIRNNKQI